MDGVFQSLFWWISLLGGGGEVYSMLAYGGFQSLFWWISLLGACAGWVLDHFPREFQSLFWWISLLGSRPSTACARSRSRFNPCFGGSRSSAAMAESGLHRRLLVSILVLVDLAPRLFVQIHARTSPFGFQSLFWWISLLGTTAQRYMRLARVLFQSLFWWISLLGGLQRCHIALAPGFQSLFWWISLLGLYATKDCADQLRFQSLFWWISLLGRFGLQVHFVP